MTKKRKIMLNKGCILNSDKHYFALLKIYHTTVEPRLFEVPGTAEILSNNR